MNWPVILLTACLVVVAVVISNTLSLKPPPSPQTLEDEEVRAFWGGSCLSADWERCKLKKRLRGRFWVPNLPPEEAHKSVQYHPNRTIDCSLLKPYWCLKNSWTVTDCQLLCMANCNRVVLKDLFNYVSHAGECPLIDY